MDRDGTESVLVLLRRIADWCGRFPFLGGVASTCLYYVVLLTLPTLYGADAFAFALALCEDIHCGYSLRILRTSFLQSTEYIAHSI